VSAHAEQFKESEPPRNDVAALLGLDGTADDAIYGWFFGHEHRCALYRDSGLRFNARLIGNGCIPHEAQKERGSDPGCTQADFFNKKAAVPGTDTAASCFAELTFKGPRVAIEYVDETNGPVGTGKTGCQPANAWMGNPPIGSRNWIRGGSEGELRRNGFRWQNCLIEVLVPSAAGSVIRLPSVDTFTAPVAARPAYRPTCAPFCAT
jgi:hypothetical protein